MNMKRKVLIIQENLKGGGAEKVLIDILNHFDYKRYDVTLLLLFNSGVYLGLIPKEVHVKTLFGESLTKFHYICSKLSMYSIRNMYLKYLLNKLLEELEFDTIVSFMEGYSCLMHDLIRNRGRRHISWVHTDLKINNWCLNVFGSIEKQRSIYNRMDDVVFVSNGAKEAFNDIFQAHRDKTIYNLIDSSRIKNKSKSFKVDKKKFTVVNVGRLTDQKRQERIIEVAKILKKRRCEIEYWILGTGEREAELKTLVRNESLEEIVLFKGFQNNPYPFVDAADVFLLTSQTEGYPLVVCEALCLGKPIVSTAITGTEELLSSGFGLLCSYNTVELADAVECLYRSPELLKQYEKKATQRANIFDPQKTMREIYSVIDGCM